MSKVKSIHQPTPSGVLGHRIPRVRPTGWGVFWVLVYLGLPVFFLGNLLDFMFQYLFGWCIGVWCVFQS